MRRLFELYKKYQKESATSFYEQQQSNLLMPNNLFTLITHELRTE